MASELKKNQMFLQAKDMVHLILIHARPPGAEGGKKNKMHVEGHVEEQLNNYLWSSVGLGFYDNGVLYRPASAWERWNHLSRAKLGCLNSHKESFIAKNDGGKE